jgi:alkaline phosphatase D
MAAAPLKDDTCPTSKAETNVHKHPSRILFGSCNSQAYPQPLWPAIVARNATAWVWAGDAIYSDAVVGNDYFPPKAIIDHPTVEKIEDLYSDLRQHPGYKQLLEHHTAIMGTWDDHDFGTNNGDMHFPLKRESAIAFVNFLGEAPDSAMGQRARDGRGVYGVKVIDFDRPVGEQVLTEEEAGLDPDVVQNRKQPISYSNHSVAVFVLDVRSYKTKWTKQSLDTKGDFLGEVQWKWLEEALSRSKTAVNIVVQGLQVHADRHPDGNVAEAWSRFPAAQQRLYDLLLQQRPPSILVSGDVHMAELMRKDCRNQNGQVKSLTEVTTSGMTHSWGTRFCSRPTSNFICRYPYGNWVLRQSMHFAHWINPLNELILSESGEMQYSLDLNFAEFEFDWEKNALIVRILGQDGVLLLTTEWSLDDLNQGLQGSKLQEKHYQAIEKSQEELGLPKSHWICVSYRGVAHPYHRPFALTLTFLMPTTMLLGPIFVAIVLFTTVIRRFLKRGKPNTQT